MIIHTDNLRRFPDQIAEKYSFDPEFYIPRVKHVYELDLYTFDERIDYSKYICSTVIRKIRKELIKGIEMYVLQEAEFASTFWISTTRLSNSNATDPVYIASTEDLESWVDFEELAESLEERFELEDLLGEAGFLREVDIRTWRDETKRVRPWLHMERCHFWFPVPHQEWYLWDNELGYALPDFDNDEDWNGKVKLTRKEFECDGRRDVMAFGDDDHAQAELFYIIEMLLARFVGGDYHPEKIALKSLKFQLHQSPEEKTKPKKAVPIESKDWVPEKINRGRTSRKPKYQD